MGPPSLPHGCSRQREDANLPLTRGRVLARSASVGSLGQRAAFSCCRDNARSRWPRRLGVHASTRSREIGLLSRARVHGEQRSRGYGAARLVATSRRRVVARMVVDSAFVSRCCVCRAPCWPRSRENAVAVNAHARVVATMPERRLSREGVLAMSVACRSREDAVTGFVLATWCDRENAEKLAVLFCCIGFFDLQSSLHG